MRTDAEIQRAVLAELKWDPRVEETEVGVEVDDGVVTLTGNVPTYVKCLAAQEAAAPGLAGAKQQPLRLPALPFLRRQETSAIVNIASIAALRMSGDRPHIAYSASKMGVIGLSKSVAMEQARKGVRCNVVVPGLMNTPLVETPRIAC